MNSFSYSKLLCWTWQSHTRFPGFFSHQRHKCKIRPHRRCKGRDHPDGISPLRFRFTWDGFFFGKNLLFLIDRDARLQKTLYGTDLFVNPPAKPRPEKSEKTSGFSTFFGFIFWVYNVIFLVADVGWPGSGFFVILDAFLDSFSDFFQARNTGFYGMFVFCRSLTAIFKNAKTIVNTSVLCRPVAKNLANTTVFWRWV